MAIVLIFILIFLSAIFVSKIVETSINAVRGLSSRSSDFRGRKAAGPPWKIRPIWVAVLLFIFTLLGVMSCFYIILGPDTNLFVLLVITVLVVGGSYGARTHKDEIDVGDFFTSFTLGFGWPAAWPLLAQRLGVHDFLLILPNLTPTPVDISNPESFLGLPSMFAAILVQIYEHTV